MSNQDAHFPDNDNRSSVASRPALRYGLIGSLILLVGVAVFVRYVRETPQQLLERADAIHLTDPAQALTKLERAIAAQGGQFPQAELLRCQVLMSVGRTNEVADCLRNIDDRASFDPVRIVEFTDEARKRDRLDLAKQALHLALKSDSRQAHVLRTLIDVEYELGDDRAVLEHCLAYAELKPDDALPWLVSAGIHHYNERAIEAIDAYQNALKRTLESEEAARAHYQSAVLSLYVGDLQHAREHVDWLTTRQAGEAEILLLQAELLHREGEMKQATEVVDQVLKRNPQSTGGLLRRGLLYFDRGQFQSAVEDLARVVVMEPSHRKAHYALGQGYLRLDQPAAARRHLDESQRLTELEAEGIRSRNRPEHSELKPVPAVPH